jgi:hypothetical protein
MRKILYAVSVSLLVSSVTTCKNACNESAPVAPVLSTLPPLGICIVQASLADWVDNVTDPLAIVSSIVTACQQYGVVTVEAILTYIESALTSTPALDSGVGLSAKQLARLGKVHTAAVSQQHFVPVPALLEAGLGDATARNFVGQ